MQAFKDELLYSHSQTSIHKYTGWVAQSLRTFTSTLDSDEEYFAVQWDTVYTELNVFSITIFLLGDAIMY